MSKLRSDLNIELLKLTTAGSVDDGKSTLIGRLLYDCQAVFEDQLSAISRVKKKGGNDEIDLSLLLDGLSAEREQGITIDVAYRYFSTPNRRFIIADVPGHEQYTKNMVTGASSANLALILIDARKGLLNQSKRHMFIASLLGIPHILIIVNKMDLVDYNSGVFDNIKSDVEDYSAKLDIKDLQFIPVSALKGDMVVDRGDSMDWFKGPTLLSYLENLHVASDRNLIDFRFPVQCVLRPNQDFRGYAGLVEGGSVRKGENVVILPSGEKSSVKSIIYDENKVDFAFDRQSVAITLEDEVDVSRGDMIVKEGNVPEMTNNLDATLCWFSDKSLKLNKRYILKSTTKSVPVFINDLKYLLDIDSLSRKSAKNLKKNEIGRVNISSNEPVMVDPYSRNRNTGSFVIFDEQTNDTVGAGIIINKGKKLDYLKNDQNFVAKKGSVLWFTGLSGSGKTTIADKLYEFLRKKDIKCERLDGDVMRESLSSDLGFSKTDRNENINRVEFVANMLSKHGVIVLATFISPYRERREMLRKNLEGFVEIYIDTPLEVCESRDVKGLYKKARDGEIEFFTGISDPYEEPENPEISIKTQEEAVDDAVSKIVDYLIGGGFISNIE